jgi:hypothetical protein
MALTAIGKVGRPVDARTLSRNAVARCSLGDSGKNFPFWKSFSVLVFRFVLMQQQVLVPFSVCSNRLAPFYF